MKQEEKKTLQIPYEECTDGSIIWRYSKNPIIGRNPNETIARAFNSAVVEFNSKFVGIFRGDTKSTIPYLYYGESEDGINFKINKDPIVFYNIDGSKHEIEYAYDPRVVKIDDTFYIMWCNGSNGAPTIGLAQTKDFKKYTFISSPFLPFNRNGVLFPKKINGEFAMLSRPSDGGHTPFGDIFISYSKDLVYWGKHQLVMKPSWQWWQSTKIGAGPFPIETKEGWILIYHGVTKTCAGMVYSIGAALLDLNDPSKVIGRTDNYLMTPEMEYETVGFVPNVVFPCAALVDDKGRIAIYYGAADTYLSLAFTTVDKLLSVLKK